MAFATNLSRLTFRILSFYCIHGWQIEYPEAPCWGQSCHSHTLSATCPHYTHNFAMVMETGPNTFCYRICHWRILQSIRCIEICHRFNVFILFILFRIQLSSRLRMQSAECTMHQRHTLVGMNSNRERAYSHWTPPESWEIRIDPMMIDW